MTIRKFTEYEIDLSKNNLPHELRLTFEEFSALTDKEQEALILEAENYKDLYRIEAKEFKGVIEVQSIKEPSILEVAEMDKSLVIHRRVKNIY